MLQQQKPNTRPQELRYKIADAINDVLKAIPGFHPLAKHVASSFLQARKKIHAQTGPVPNEKQDSLIPQASASNTLPIPPLEMRELVGATDLTAFDNPSGMLAFPELTDPGVYKEVFDFGCGCGRMARQLIQQHPRPNRYLGIDLHLGMIRWCQKNLQPFAPNFEFVHHDVFNVGFNPGRRKSPVAQFPAADSSFTLVNAHSVFTHLTQDQTRHYLGECARVLRPDGVLRATWFLFDKADFPMMQEHDNALYVQYIDPSAVVIYDKNWLRETARTFGLTIFHAIAPAVRGYQWIILMTRSLNAMESEFPPDTAPRNVVRPPLCPKNASTIGLR